MLNAALIHPTETLRASGSISRYMPRDPSQMVFRQLLARLDEDALVDIESDIEYFLESGEMSRNLSELLSAVDEAA